MTGHRLVQRERYHLVCGSGLRPVKVDEVSARARTVRRRTTIISSRSIGRNRGRDRFHTVGHARQSLEDFYQVRVNALRHSLISLEKLFRSFVVEARVRAKEFKKILQAASEMKLIHDGLHLCAYATHFAQSQIMNLLGRHVSRSKFAREECVHLLPARHLPYAHLIERGWQVFVRIEFM